MKKFRRRGRVIYRGFRGGRGNFQNYNFPRRRGSNRRFRGRRGNYQNYNIAPPPNNTDNSVVNKFYLIQKKVTNINSSGVDVQNKKEKKDSIDLPRTIEYKNIKRGPPDNFTYTTNFDEGKTIKIIIKPPKAVGNSEKLMEIVKRECNVEPKSCFLIYYGRKKRNLHLVDIEMFILTFPSNKEVKDLTGRTFEITKGVEKDHFSLKFVLDTGFSKKSTKPKNRSSNSSPTSLGAISGNFTFNQNFFSRNNKAMEERMVAGEMNKSTHQNEPYLNFFPDEFENDPSVSAETSNNERLERYQNFSWMKKNDEDGGSNEEKEEKENLESDSTLSGCKRKRENVRQIEIVDDDEEVDGQPIMKRRKLNSSGNWQCYFIEDSKKEMKTRICVIKSRLRL